MDNQKIANVLKVLLWVGMIIVLFTPWYLFDTLFFPFIVSKTVIFNITVEVMLLLFLALCYFDRNCKVRVNLAVVLFGLYIGIVFISSLLGDDFYRSFWSTNERSEGLLLLLHLFTFLTIITSYFRKFKEWLWIFDIFTLSSLVIATHSLIQYLGYLESSAGVRLASRVGNPGYLAGLMVFATFIALFLMFYRKNIWLKFLYGSSMILFIFIVYNTQTRGGMVALLFTLPVFLLFLGFVYFFKYKVVRNSIFGLLIAFIALSGYIYANREADWVSNNETLKIITTMSFNSTTVQNRIWTWQSAYQGFKEKPLLGWGYENFYEPFDKYFNPKIYRKEASVAWFDRAHNIIFDRLLTGGILGLILYLSFIFLPFYYLWKYFMKKDEGNRKLLMPSLLSLLIIAYFIQNLFIFEALVTYIPLILVIGFTSLFSWQYKGKFFEDRNVKISMLTATVILILPVIYFVNVKPLQANIKVTKALSSSELTMEQRFEMIQDVLSEKNPGNEEYQKQLMLLAEKLVSSNFEDKELLQNILAYTEEELKKQAEDNPYSATSQIIMMRFNSLMFGLTANFDYYNTNEEIFEGLKEIAPNRQHVYMEVALMNFYAGNLYKENDQPEIAEKYYDIALEYNKKAFYLNEENYYLQMQLFRTQIYAGKNEELVSALTDIDTLLEGFYANCKKTDFLGQLINTAVEAKNYEIIGFAAQELIKTDPDNPNYYIQLALSYAYTGQDEKAIETAEKVAEYGGEYEKQSIEFIKNVKTGFFKQ